MAKTNNVNPRGFVRKSLLEGGDRHDATFLAEYGRSARYISARTGLSKSAVYYACRLAGVRISDYRNGIGNVSRIIEKLTQAEVDAELYRHLRKTL